MLWIERQLQYEKFPHVGTLGSLINPVFQSLPHFPQVDLSPFLNLFMKCVFNICLIYGFGLCHSLLAQHSTHKMMQIFIPQQACRSFFLVVTGVYTMIVMSLWQPTGIILWKLIEDTHLANSVSFGLFFLGICGILGVLCYFDIIEFMGFRQLFESSYKEIKQTAGSRKLITNGVYGIVRHPIYTFFMISFFITPTMTLDRFVFGLAHLTYLIFAIPLEEKKLLSQFGPAYELYRKRVAAVIPYVF